MPEFWYIATVRFGPARGEDWKKYREWSKLPHLNRLLSLDGILCPPVIAELTEEDWRYNVQEDYWLDYFRDPDFLIRRIDNLETAADILAVVRNPELDCATLVPGPGFRFAGYDLIEAATGVSALTNCGGFDDVFSPADLSEVGLISDFSRVVVVRNDLKRKHPEESHADCELMAVWELETNAFVKTTVDDVILRESFEHPAIVRLHVRNLLADLPAVADAKGKARILGEIGYCERVLGQLDEAERHLAEARLIAMSDPALKRQAVAYSIRLGHVYHWKSRWDDALALFTTQLQVCNDDVDLHDMADFALQHRGKMYFDRGDYSAAQKDFAAALVLREKKGEASLVASTRQALAAVKVRTHQND